MSITWGSLSDSGPRPVNEDNLDCWTVSSGEMVACIADGLGGMGGGDVASRLAIRQFRSFLERTRISEDTLLTAAHSAHDAIRMEQKTAAASRMATTLTAVALSDSGIVGVHCGDSRAAIARGKGIKRLTKDHSEGQRLFEAGKLSKDELADYQRKHILESALGDSSEPRIDSFRFDLLPGDRVVLTTDGVHNVVLLRELHFLITESSSAEVLVKKVADNVRLKGPTDNFSILALFVD